MSFWSKAFARCLLVAAALAGAGCNDRMYNVPGVDALPAPGDGGNGREDGVFSIGDAPTNPFDGPPCNRVTCTVPGGQYCGVIGDGCGGTIDCGGCPTGQLCGGAGIARVCAPIDCKPVTCEQQGGN